MRSENEKKPVFDSVAVFGAAVWAIAFAVLHFAWAAGFYIFLAKDLASKAFEQKWFLAYDLAAGFLCVVGAILIFLSAYPLGNRSFRRTVTIFAVFGTVILVLRAVAGIGKILYFLVQKQSFAEAISFWDLWFCLGAVFFTASLWQNMQRGRLLKLDD